MDALEKLRTRTSVGIISLLWLNFALLVARNLLRAEAIDLPSLIAAAIITIMATATWWRDSSGPATRESGGAKVGHGSGGIIQPRAE